MPYSAGVDVGSTQTKAVVIDERRALVGRALIDTGANVVAAAEGAFAEALADAGLLDSAIDWSWAPATAATRVTFGNIQVTEISCHGARRGAHVPRHADGRGHGRAGHQGHPRGADRRDRRLLHERQVRRRHGAVPRRRVRALDIPLDELGPTALRAERPVQITHHLHGVRRVRGAVLAGAGQEDRGHPAGRAPVDRLARHRPAAPRGDRARGDLHGRRHAQRGHGQGARRALGFAPNVSPDSHFMGAIGAALFAMDRILDRRDAAGPAEGAR